MQLDEAQLVSVDWAEAKNWAVGVQTQPEKYLFLDTETTGLSGNDEIIQLCIMDGSGAELFNSVVKPTTPIHPAAQKVHGLTAAALFAAPAFTDVYLKIAECFSPGKIVVIYNAAFDIRLLNQTCKKYNLPIFSFEWECAMLWASQYNGLRRGNNYQWVALSGGDHSAKGDCVATLKTVLKMARGE